MLIKESELREIVKETLVKEGFWDWITGNSSNQEYPDWMDDNQIQANEKEKWANKVLELASGSKSDRKKAYQRLKKAPSSLLAVLKSTSVGRGLATIPKLDNGYKSWYKQSYKKHNSADNAEMWNQQQSHKPIPQDWIIISRSYPGFRVNWKTNKPRIDLITTMSQPSYRTYLQTSDIRGGKHAYNAMAQWVNDTYPRMF